ncbi:MAG: MBL fold metallo-hydrolase [Candidatus Diapherotrites archaeon]|nr:MBL fold metallo-hydrolase [Candidatus Diapherotrites archaeon]
MRISIVYDNTALAGLKPDWGFSSLVELEGAPKILFDTGANSDILLNNMKKMNIDPTAIDEVFISHPHWDHVGGLDGFLDRNSDVIVYAPDSFSESITAKLVKIKKSTKLHTNVFSTGELAGIEQSLVLKTKKGLVVLVGCSHPGVDKILEAASAFGKPYALVGGFHDFHDFDVLNGLKVICPIHCTRYKDEIKEAYPKRYVEGGAGRILEL